jgi:hypothetical protein
MPVAPVDLGESSATIRRPNIESDWFANRCRHGKILSECRIHRSSLLNPVPVSLSGNIGVGSGICRGTGVGGIIGELDGRGIYKPITNIRQVAELGGNSIPKVIVRAPSVGTLNSSPRELEGVLLNPIAMSSSVDTLNSSPRELIAGANLIEGSSPSSVSDMSAYNQYHREWIHN